MTEVALEPGALVDVTLAAYPDFGHYVISGSRFYLAIRCPHRAFGAAAGHFHDDMLAVELQIERKKRIGPIQERSYTLRFPIERNTVPRCASYHSVPRPANVVGADLTHGLFKIANVPGGRCMYFGIRGFAGEAAGPGWRTIRAVVCSPDRIVIADGCLTGPLAPLVPSEKLPNYCNGYGRQTAYSPRSF